uniref:Protein Nef n=1 Tax=Human immunodeficiency virus type 1 TaxID=11676 RepID=A0A192ZI59_HV1|nr:nef protein [Human immunodeficiency virus 1]
MGGKWSKRRAPGWDNIRERMRRTEPAEGGGAASPDLLRRGALPTTSTTANNAACAWWVAPQEEEEVCFPVPPLPPLPPMTYEGALHLNLFLKEEGGLGGIISSQKRQNLLLRWVYHTQGFFPGWNCSPPGPGVKYPLTFGWCFKLPPDEPEEVEDATVGDNCCLLPPINLHGMDDPKKELLMWYFDSLLSFHHTPQENHPEYYNSC